MSNFREYPIYKKRDGQNFKYSGFLFAESFEKAKKQFALDMTNRNWEKSNDIVWLTKEEDKVSENGWYDLSQSWFRLTHPDEGDETEGEPDFTDAIMELICSEASIQEGFDSWNEDVYTWELRDVKPSIEDFDIDIDKETMSVIITIRTDNGILEISGELEPYDVGRDIIGDYKFCPSWFSDDEAENIYNENWEVIENKIQNEL
ncbi:MAG TPA: hypothetical protein VIV55_10270 [Flavobacterium sp.]